MFREGNTTRDNDYRSRLNEAIRQLGNTGRDFAGKLVNSRLCARLCKDGASRLMKYSKSKGKARGLSIADAKCINFEAIDENNSMKYNLKRQKLINGIMLDSRYSVDYLIKISEN